MWMLIVKKMTGVVLLALAMTAVPLAAARADQSERTAVQQNREESRREQVPAAGKPEIFVAQPNHDIGEVWEGDTIVHTFTVENRGTAPLEITKVSPG
jgi:hypothetical protein